MCFFSNIKYIRRCTLQDTDKGSRLSSSNFAYNKKIETETSLPKDLLYDFHAALGLSTGLMFKISNCIDEISCGYS